MMYSPRAGLVLQLNLRPGSYAVQLFTAASPMQRNETTLTAVEQMRLKTLGFLAGGLGAVAVAMLIRALPLSSGDRGNTHHAQLVEEMLTAEGCASPCFFGRSLHATTLEGAHEVLEASRLTQDADLTFVTTPSGQEIRWQWPPEVAEELTSDDRSLYSGYNYISFTGGVVWEMRLQFAISLDELIDALGPPSAVFPRALLPHGNVAWNLVYEDPVGYFDVRTECYPQLSPHQTVYHYYYNAYLQTNLVDTSHPVTLWSGYSTDLPDCATMFQPQ